MVCKALASLDDLYILVCYTIYHFNPQGSREPRRICWKMVVASCDFNPQGSREPRQRDPANTLPPLQFQSTRLSRASTMYMVNHPLREWISIHKALASLDFPSRILRKGDIIFQSTRLSRASTRKFLWLFAGVQISIHKALASLDFDLPPIAHVLKNFNPQGSREPRPGNTVKWE